MEAAQLTDMVIGTVTSIDPVEITADVHQDALKSEVLILTDTVMPKSVDIPGVGEVVITKPLSVGEKVLMLKVKHGQQFVVLSRI